MSIIDRLRPLMCAEVLVPLGTVGGATATIAAYSWGKGGRRTVVEEYETSPVQRQKMLEQVVDELQGKTKERREFQERIEKLERQGLDDHYVGLLVNLAERGRYDRLRSMLLGIENGEQDSEWFMRLYVYAVNDGAEGLKRGNCTSYSSDKVTAAWLPDGRVLVGYEGRWESSNYTRAEFLTDFEDLGSLRSKISEFESRARHSKYDRKELIKAGKQSEAIIQEHEGLKQVFMWCMRVVDNPKPGVWIYKYRQAFERLGQGDRLKSEVASLMLMHHRDLHNEAYDDVHYPLKVVDDGDFKIFNCGRSDRTYVSVSAAELPCGGVEKLGSYLSQRINEGLCERVGQIQDTQMRQMCIWWVERRDDPFDLGILRVIDRELSNQQDSYYYRTNAWKPLVALIVAPIGQRRAYNVDIEGNVVRAGEADHRVSFYLPSKDLPPEQFRDAVLKAYNEQVTSG